MRRKGVLLCLILLGLGLGYVVVALGVSGDSAVSERHLGEARRDDIRQLRLYVEVLAIDAVNYAIRLRVSLAPSPALRGRRSDAADQDLRIEIAYGEHAQELVFHAQEAMMPATFEVDLDGGAVAAYPFDRFRAGLRVSAREASGTSIPLQVTVWEGVAGWSLNAIEEAANAANEVRLGLSVRRTAALKFLVLAVYAVMVLVACSALTIGGLIFMRMKPAESTMTGALTAMVFTLPALRYTLPGSPPLGVRADLLVFFWAELATAVALMLFVVTWAQVRGPTK